MSVDVGSSSKAGLLATAFATLTVGCGLFPSLSQFEGKVESAPDAASHARANAPCGFAAPEYLKAPLPLAAAGFGSTIVTDGTTLVVVAPQERLDAAPTPETRDFTAGCPIRRASPAPPSGAIHLFERDGDTWLPRPFEIAGADQITGAAAGPEDGPAILANNNFSLISVALNDSWLAVGLAGDNQPGTLLRGSVRLFQRTSSGSYEATPPLIEPLTDSFAFFGYSVALSGSTLVVGAPGALPAVLGAAYVYDLGQDPPALEKQLQPAALEQKAVFGADVAISADWVVVGAPGEHGTGLYGDSAGVGAAYVYRRSDLEQWQRLAPNLSSLPQAFGTRFVLDGNLLLVGAPSTDGCQGNPSFRATGVINPFELESGTWTERPCISAHDDHAGLFGWSLAVSADKLVVGAPFSWHGDPFAGGPSGERSPLESTGAAAGRTYVFDRRAGGFVKSCFLESPNPDPCDNFGQSVALGGGLLGVGSFGEDGQKGDTGTPDEDNGLMDSGAVYLFPLSSQGRAKALPGP